jgi:membrane fusion protein, multidrug efflux system
MSQPAATPAIVPELLPGGQPVPARRRRGRTAYLVLGSVVGALLVVYAVTSLLTWGREDTDDAQVEADVVVLSARVSAPVLTVHVADNQRVKKGQILIDLDPVDYDIKLAQAQAEQEGARAQADAAAAQLGVVDATARGGFVSAQAQVSGSTDSVRSAEAQVAAARAALAKARAEAGRTANDLDRARRLAAEDALPKAQLDAAEYAAAAANAQVAQSEAQLAAAQDQTSTARAHTSEARGRLTQSASVDSQVAGARAAKKLADARLEAARVAVRQAEQQLGYTHVTAPSDGVLSRLSVHPGQMVQTGSVLVAVVPTETYVVANFKETQVGRMRAGQPVRIAIDTYPGRDLRGRVVSLSPATGARFSLLPPDNATGNFVKVVQRVPVKIAWDGVPADLVLQAGQSVEVSVYTR